jgi:hypothetical protein
MITCSKCSGLTSYELNLGYGWYLRIEAGLLTPGEQPAIPVCKCDEETSSIAGWTSRYYDDKIMETLSQPLHKVNYRMPKANDRQVGGLHYKGEGEEHWDRVQRLGLDYFQAQITKYVERCWRKNGLEDLEKAQHFLDKYIEIHRTSQAKNPYKDPIGPYTAGEAGPGYVDQGPDGRSVVGEAIGQSPQSLCRKGVPLGTATGRCGNSECRVCYTPHYQPRRGVDCD